MEQIRPPTAQTALARQHRLPILSRDEHFDFVPGVKRIDW